MLYICDLVGVFAFAFLGARSALQQKLNIWGVLTCAFLASLGGGTIRSLILNKVPFYFYDHTYALVACLSCGLAVLSHYYFSSRTLDRAFIFLDAMGMITFAYIGARAAGDAHLGLVGILCFAFLTACGGGVLCDVIARQPPHIFHKNLLYAAPPLAVGLGFWVFGSGHYPLSWALFMATAFIFQLSVACLPANKLRHLLGAYVKKARSARVRLGTANVQADRVPD